MITKTGTAIVVMTDKRISSENPSNNCNFRENSSQHKIQR